MAKLTGTLQARDFLFLCEELAVASLGPELAPPHRKVMWTILQMHYGDATVHFELQPMPARSQIELGLHFEGPAAANDRWAMLIASRSGQFRCALGPEWELEEWTASWRRIHRVFRFEALTHELATEVADALATAVRVLGPVIGNLEPES